MTAFTNYELRITIKSKMNFAVLQFPASNCDQDALHALRDVLGHSARYVWHKETSLGNADEVSLCQT